MRTPKEELLRRIDKLRLAMAAKNVDVLISGSCSQIHTRGIVRYFLDYYVPVFEEYMVIPLNGPVTMIPHDYAGARYAASSPVIEEILPVPTGVSPAAFVADAARKINPKRIGIANTDGLSASFVDAIRAEFDGFPMEDLTGDIWKIRQKKSAFELEETILTVRINEDSFLEFLKEVKPGARDIDAMQKARSLTDRMEWTEDQYWMVGTGTNAGFWVYANEHPTTWKQGDLIVGITEHAGPGGHWGEVTNLISIGEPEPVVVKAQAALAEAQVEAFRTIRPGNTIGQMADAAQKTLEDLGFAEKITKDSPVRYFGHSQGIDVFEPPVIMPGSDRIMEEGMRLNFHPSASLPDGRKFNYCVCYMVTKDGGMRLTNLADTIYIV